MVPPLSANDDATCADAQEGLAKGERGAVMIVGLFMSFGLIGCCWFVIGIGRAFLFRERAQEAADSVAMGAAIIQARGMNVIATINVFLLMITYTFLSFRMIEALFYHMLQVIGLPSGSGDGYSINGFGPSRYSIGEVDGNNFEPGGMRTCDQLSQGGSGSHAATIPTTIDLSSKDGILQSAWACAGTPTNGKRYQAYLDATGLAGTLPDKLPEYAVITHNTIRAVNMFIEDSNQVIVDALIDAQDDAAVSYATSAASYAGFMALDFDLASWGGPIGNMKNAQGPKATGYSIDQKKLPIQTDKGAKGKCGFGFFGKCIIAGSGAKGESDRTLNALCLRAAMTAKFTASSFALGDPSPRINGPIVNAGAIVVNGTTFNNFFANAVVLSDVTREFWCDNRQSGAAGGKNYWTTRHYAFFPDGRSDFYTNGGDAFLVKGDIGGTLTDNTRKEQAIATNGAVTAPASEDEAGRYFSASEYFFNCAGKWESSACNGKPADGVATDADMTLFRTGWAARLVHADAPGGGLSAH